MYRDIRTITNGGTEPLVVWLEPWVEEVQIAPGMSAVFIGESGLPGELEVLESSRPCVFGWSGSSMRVEVNGEVVWTSYLPVPNFGTSVRTLLNVVGLRSDADEA